MVPVTLGSLVLSAFQKNFLDTWKFVSWCPLLTLRFLKRHLVDYIQISAAFTCLKNHLLFLSQ